MTSPFLQFWLRVQALIWLPLFAWHGLDTAALPSRIWTFVVAASLLALVAILRAVRRLSDFVTIARVVGLLVIAFLFPAPVSWWIWAAILGLATLDIVDGMVARHFGPTLHGAILDMEADQLTVVLLALLLVRDGAAAHVLLAPAVRYLFVLLMWVLRLPAHDPKPVDGDNRRGRFCCLLVMVSLLAALMPVMPDAAVDLLTAVAVLVLAFSFASDARFLASRLRSTRAVQ